MEAATAKVQDEYELYANAQELIQSTIVTPEDREKLSEALAQLFKKTTPPRITYLFRGLRSGDCDIYFRFDPQILTKSGIYGAGQPDSTDQKLDVATFQDDLISRLFTNYDFCEAILTDKSTQSLVVSFPNVYPIKGGTWLNDCIREMRNTLEQHGYKEPVFRDGKFLH